MHTLFLKNKSARGFTLMEVMVAVSIFTIIVTVGIGALLTVNSANKKSQLDRQAVDSLSYAVESMSRSLRTAQNWVTTAGASHRIDFTDQDEHDVSYSYDPNSFTIIKSDSSVDGGGPYPMVPESVKIDDLTFTSYGGLGTQFQSYLQINISGTITNGKQSSTFALQTSVSKRLLDSQ